MQIPWTARTVHSRITPGTYLQISIQWRKNQRNWNPAPFGISQPCILESPPAPCIKCNDLMQLFKFHFKAHQRIKVEKGKLLSTLVEWKHCWEKICWEKKVEHEQQPVSAVWALSRSIVGIECHVGWWGLNGELTQTAKAASTCWHCWPTFNWLTCILSMYFVNSFLQKDYLYMLELLTYIFSMYAVNSLCRSTFYGQDKCKDYPAATCWMLTLLTYIHLPRVLCKLPNF